MKSLGVNLLIIFFLVLPERLSANVIRIGCPLDSPPFVYENEGRGIEIELIERVLQKIGYQAEWIYLPAKRILPLLEDGHIDAATRVYAKRSEDLPLSKPYITFQNIAATIDPEINELTIDDFANYELVAFQYAKLNLGADYANAVSKNPHYIEIADQVRQVHLMMKKRIRVVVMELRIFEYFMRIHYPDQQTKKFFLFEKIDHSMVFADSKLRDLFDAALIQEDIKSIQSQIYEQYDARLIESD